MSVDKTSVVSADKTSVVSADISQDTPQAFSRQVWRMWGGGCLGRCLQTQPIDVLSADATDVLAADTTDVLPADTTHVLPADKFGVGNPTFANYF